MIIFPCFPRIRGTCPVSPPWRKRCSGRRRISWLWCLGESVSVPRQECWDDETYRSVLLKKLRLYTWDGTNETAFDYVDAGESFRDNGDGTVNAETDLPLPAPDVLPVPVGVKALEESE